MNITEKEKLREYLISTINKIFNSEKIVPLDEKTYMFSEQIEYEKTENEITENEITENEITENEITENECKHKRLYDIENNIPFPFMNTYGLDFSEFVPLKENEGKNIDISIDELLYNYADLSDIIVQKMIEFKKDTIDFTLLSKKYTINSNFINKFIDKIDFKELSKNNKIIKDDYMIIKEFSDHFDWKDVCENIFIQAREELEENETTFIKIFKEKIEWDSIIKNKTFDEKLIEKYSEHINWKLLIDAKEDLSPEFIRIHMNKLNIDTFEKAEKIFNKIKFSEIEKVNLFNNSEVKVVPYCDIRKDINS